MASDLIVVDVGNTSTAIGLWKGGKVSAVKHFDGDERGAFAYARALAKRAKCVSYISVVPEKDARWLEAFRRLALKVHRLSYRDFMGESSPVKLDYPKPSTIGADRLADALGAVVKYGAPIIVMDFGTALTAALITKDRVWRGGVIAPGFPLMRDYLFERTAKLPRMKLGRGAAPRLGRSTEEAMRFGALVGYRGMVREIVRELERNFKTRFKLVATGGFAKWVLKDLDLPFIIDPTLTLYGAGLVV